MTIGEKIKSLRQQNGVTQEKLAEYLNISYQSISKWENNNAVPDFSLLVPIANFFAVTLDELFDRNDAAEKEEVENAMWETQRMISRGEYEDVLSLWRTLISKYPKNYECQAWYSGFLYQSLGAADADEKSEEVIAVCERILRDCNENGPRSSAIQTLVMLYGNGSLSVASEELAEKYADMADSIYCCREVLLRYAYFSDESREKAKCCRNELTLDLMNFLCDNLYYANDPIETRVHARRCAVALWDCLIDDGNYLFYHHRLSLYYALLAQDLAELGDRDGVIESLENSLYHAKRYDSLPEGQHKYTAELVSSAECNILVGSGECAPTSVQTFAACLGRACFDPYRDDPDFRKLTADR